MIVAGVAALIVVPAIDLPGRASSGRLILREFNSTMSPRGLAALHTSFGMIDAFGTQFVGETLPGIQHDLGLTRNQLDGLLRSHFPAVWRGVQEIPPALALVRPVVPRIEAMAADYRSVARIPGLGLPLGSVTWLVLLLGAGLLSVGAAVLLAPGRLALAAAAGVGVLMVALPLAMDLPAKFDDGTTVVSVGRVALSQRAATTAERTTHVVDDLVAEVEHSLIPTLAAKLHVSQGSLVRTLGTNYPAVARGLAEWPAVRGPGYALAAAQQASVAPFGDISDLPLGALPWIVIAPGALLALLAVGALLMEVQPVRVRSRAPAPLG
jgi:hypothetical protein